MSNQSNTLNDKPLTVQDIIRVIEKKSADGGYIYRGERKCYPKVSSSLYRDYDDIEAEGFDIENIQKKILSDAKRHIGHLPQDFRADLTAFLNVDEEDVDETVDFDLLTEIQHYDGKTNLIDFTTDYFIALFFACDGLHHKDGRVILQKADEIRNMIDYPRKPRHRVIAQKSVFVRPPRGFIEPHKDDIIIIPAKLKKSILQHLQTYHGISAEIIYNDLHGFIRNQDIHESANMLFYKGLACKKKADETKKGERQKWYKKSIRYYTEALKFNPQMVEAYHNLGVAYYYTRNPKCAIENLNKAIELNPNYAEAYNYRGLAYREENQFDDAITNYNKAIELRPNHGETYKDRGIAYCYKGDNETETRRKQYFYNNAIKDFTEAIRLKPASTDSYYHRGMTYVKKDDYNRAIEDYTKAIQLNPNYADAYYNCGEAWLHLGQWEKAKSDLTTAKDMGVDIIASFQNAYKNVSDFKQENGIQLPADIVAMLTSQ